MYEINNMKLRYTLIGVLCFSINIVLQAQQQALEGKIAGFLKGKKATVGVAVLTDKDETILHNNEVHYPLLSVFKFHVALAVLDKMNREEIPLKHIVHVIHSSPFDDSIRLHSIHSMTIPFNSVE